MSFFLLDKRYLVCYYSQAVNAGVAELADARDLKSREIYLSYRFKPGFRHQIIENYCAKRNIYRGVEQSGSSSGS